MKRPQWKSISCLQVTAVPEMTLRDPESESLKSPDPQKLHVTVALLLSAAKFWVICYAAKDNKDITKEKGSLSYLASSSSVLLVKYFHLQIARKLTCGHHTVPSFSLPVSITHSPVTFRPAWENELTTRTWAFSRFHKGDFSGLLNKWLLIII